MIETSATASESEQNTASSHTDETTSELVARIVTYCIVLGATLFTFIQMRPALLFANTTDVGGDNAAHVVANYYFVYHVFPHLSAWDPQWFGGFPLYVFYFPLPAVLTAILSHIFSFNVAFKLVTASGSILLPVAAYLFGRLVGFARPIPALLSVAMLAFLFNTSYTIDGGNLPSTLAGEYSFSLSLVFAILFLGALIYSLRTGRRRWVAPILFAFTLLCHVVPALFAVGGVLAITLFWRDRRRAIRYALPMGVSGGLLSAFWLLRFAVDLPYASSMGYTRVTGFWRTLLPASPELLVPLLAFIGVLYAVVRGQRVILAFAAMAIGSALAFQILPSGLVFNGRWLPFWFLTTAVIAAYGVAELGTSIFGQIGFRWVSPIATPSLAGLGAIALISAYLGVLPIYSNASNASSFIPSWVHFNYSGYQGEPGWQNFQNLTAMLTHETKIYGCGRLDYEYAPNITTIYGSTLVPMSFPMWTNGCVATAEGLYYESSTATPYHFLDQSEVSLQASNPVVGLPYQTTNLADGVRHLALTGVRYFLANSVQIENMAKSDPLLTEIASAPEYAGAAETSSGAAAKITPRFVLYLIKDSPLVRPLSYLPVVESNISKAQWLTVTESWYQTETEWPVVLTKTGPASWLRVPVGTHVLPLGATKITPTVVSETTYSNSRISFHVSTLGKPVVVNVPYFPNWSASGAVGPIEASPNFMVVIPTSHTVTLTYGTTAVDWVGRLLTLAGLGSLLLLRSDVGPDSAPIEAAPRWVSALSEVVERRRRLQREREEHPGPTDSEANGSPKDAQPPSKTPPMTPTNTIFITPPANEELRE